MTKQQELKAAIQAVIRPRIERVIQNALIFNPFDEEEFRAARPLHAALVPHEIFKGSHFERKFVTSFGGIWELLAEIVAQQELGYAETGYTISGSIKSERLERIRRTLAALEHRSEGERGPSGSSQPFCGMTESR